MPLAPLRPGAARRDARAPRCPGSEPRTTDAGAGRTSPAPFMNTASIGARNGPPMTFPDVSGVRLLDAVDIVADHFPTPRSPESALMAAARPHILPEAYDSYPVLRNPYDTDRAADRTAVSYWTVHALSGAVAMAGAAAMMSGTAAADTADPDSAYVLDEEAWDEPPTAGLPEGGPGGFVEDVAPVAEESSPHAPLPDGRPGVVIDVQRLSGTGSSRDTTGSLTTVRDPETGARYVSVQPTRARHPDGTETLFIPRMSDDRVG